MSHPERLWDLLASRATEGLSETEAKELERALERHGDVDAEELELAAAAADVAFFASEAHQETMPSSLRLRIEEQAALHVVSSHESTPKTAPAEAIGVPRPAAFGFGGLGWLVAAAVLVLAIWAPWSRDGDPARPVTPSEARQALLAEAGDVIQVAWAPPEIEGYETVAGDVVWSTERQSGFMRLRGLPANRSRVEQYQLWIFDPSRDQHPIDGGVFDVPAGLDEVVVPIDAKLPVTEPAAFAITLEQAGGVVVSDGPLLVVAPVET